MMGVFLCRWRSCRGLFWGQVGWPMFCLANMKIVAPETANKVRRSAVEGVPDVEGVLVSDPMREVELRNELVWHGSQEKGKDLV